MVNEGYQHKAVISACLAKRFDQIELHNRDFRNYVYKNLAIFLAVCIAGCLSESADLPAVVAASALLLETWGSGPIPATTPGVTGCWC